MTTTSPPASLKISSQEHSATEPPSPTRDIEPPATFDPSVFVNLRHDHAPAVDGISDIQPTAKQLAKEEAKRHRSFRARLRRAKAAAAEGASMIKFWLFMAAISPLIAIDCIIQGCPRDYNPFK